MEIIFFEKKMLCAIFCFLKKLVPLLRDLKKLDSQKAFFIVIAFLSCD